jgi:hypothetical protein
MSTKERVLKELLDLVRERRSSRAPFDRHRPVPREALLQILEAAGGAPTAHSMLRTRAPASEGDFLQIMSVFDGGRVETVVKELLAIPEPLRIAHLLDGAE